MLGSRAKASCTTGVYLQAQEALLFKNIIIITIIIQGLICSPGWPETHHVEQAGLILRRDPFASASCVLGLMV